MTTTHISYSVNFVNVDTFNCNEHFQPANYAWPAIGTLDEFGKPTGFSDQNNEHIVSFTNRWEAVHYARLIARYFDCSVLVTKELQYTCEHGLSAELCYGPNHYALEA